MWYTLSMADNHWHDLHDILTRDKDGRSVPFPNFSSIQEEAKWKRKLARQYPHIVDAYFLDRVEKLFATVFGKNGIKLEWFWYRIEYQGRGAPHLHGCFRIKNAPELTKLAQEVFIGRQAQRILWDKKALNADDVCFETENIEKDQYTKIDQAYKHFSSPTDTELKDILRKGVESEQVISSYHDFFLSTTNESEGDVFPIDASSKVRNDATIFDPKDTPVPHPSSVNPLNVIDDLEARQKLYCQSCNVQSRHKHQAYCDKNHARREEAKRKQRSGALGENDIHPEDIPCDCRFGFHKDLKMNTHVIVKETVSNAETNSETTSVALTLGTKRNDYWMNSHMRVIMEVSHIFPSL